MSTSTERAQKHRNAHETRHEVDFILSLKKGNGKTRMQKLLQYEESMFLRSDWGEIDPDIIRQVIKSQIAEEHSIVMSMAMSRN